MEPSEYESIARLEGTHWWYVGMRRISAALLAGANLRADAVILDAGCGPGGTSALLQRYGKVVGLDLAKEAVELARKHEGLAVVRGSVGTLPFADGSFDLVTSFDVLYHRAVGDDGAAVREAARVLKPGGWFLLRLPAFEFLRSEHDRVVHTQRRYRAGQVRALVERAGLLVERLTYANAVLFPLAALKRGLERLRPHDAPQSDVQETPALLNAALTGVLALEGSLVRRWRLPLGVSVCCLARKPIG